MVRNFMHRVEELMEIGGTRKDIVLLVISGISLILSLTGLPIPLNPAWIAIILCGIAMGGVGSDIAMDAADIVLVDDQVGELAHLIALSHRMMRTITFNLTFSMTLNVSAIILAIIGTLNPVIGALVHNAGSVFVIIHSALLLNWKYRKTA